VQLAKPRTTWVWAALVLQSALFAIGLWSDVQFLVLWPRYASHTSQLLPYLVRSLAETALLGVSLIGVWRSKRWGWLLALLVDGYMCAMDLSVLLELHILAARYHRARILFFQALDYVTFALLLHRPVQRYFTLQDALSRTLGTQARKPSREIGRLERSLRIITFYAVATVFICILTVFSVTLMAGDKAGGARGFLFLLYVAFAAGGISAFLFTLIMTVLVRRQNPARLWLWILVGGLLAPGMILGMGLLGAHAMRGVAILGYVFGGALYLFQVWWLGIPIGIITAFACYQMYPWSFERA